METFENVVLLSSGLDSVVTSLMVEKRYKRTPYLVTVDMEYNKEEVKRARDIVKLLGWEDRHIVFDTYSTISGFIMRSNNNFILYRNLYFIMWADNLMMDLGKEYVKFYLGGLREDLISDNSSYGRNAIQTCLNTLRGKGEIVVTSCISEMSKPDLIRWVECNCGSGFLHDLLPLTNSCYTGDKCGCCNACLRHYFAMSSSGVQYCECMFESNPATSDKILEYVKRINSGLEKSEMEENRFNYTKEVLKELKLI